MGLIRLTDLRSQVIYNEEVRMKIRVRCKVLDVFRIPEFDVCTKHFSFLSLGYSNFFGSHFAYLNFMGFQVSMEWGC